MKKIIALLGITVLVYSSSHSQVAVFKMVGKNATNHSLGFGVFANYDFPLNDIGNQSLMIELLDFAFFPGKTLETGYEKISRGYASIKLGYRKIFSEESKTGFFIEPQLGYCRTALVSQQWAEGKKGDGIAAALEGGYSLEVGQRGSTFTFGLKYEADMAGKEKSIQALGLRVGYNFLMFRGRNQ